MVGVQEEDVVILGKVKQEVTVSWVDCRGGDRVEEVVI